MCDEAQALGFNCFVGDQTHALAGHTPDASDCRWLAVIIYFVVVLLFFIVVNVGVSRRRRGADKARPSSHVGTLLGYHHEGGY
jgi:hypothetical protein